MGKTFSSNTADTEKSNFTGLFFFGCWLLEDFWSFTFCFLYHKVHFYDFQLNVFLVNDNVSIKKKFKVKEAKVEERHVVSKTKKSFVLLDNRDQFSGKSVGLGSSDSPRKTKPNCTKFRQRNLGNFEIGKSEIGIGLS
jgi:hypothetical protein